MTEHMSPIEQERHHTERSARQEPKPTNAGIAGASEAVKEAALTRGNARAALEEELEQTRARGVEWVRPTDLMARHSSRLAGRGIDLHTELNRRVRVATGVDRLSERTRRLPPVSAFGRRGASQQGPARSGVGMR